MKSEPGAGDAVRVTTVPKSTLAEQVAPQLIAPEVEVTVPVPAPVLATVRVGVCKVKVAVTCCAVARASVQLEPTQSPLNPAKVEPTAGVAVSVTGPLEKSNAQVAPQFSPGGLEVTWPEPLPAAVTVTLAVPTPLSIATAVPPGAALADSEAGFAPTVPGWNCTVAVQLAPAASGPVQVVLVCAHAATVPVKARLGCPATLPPELVMVKVCGAEVAPSATAPKSKPVGEMVSEPGVTPRPVSARVKWSPLTVVTVRVVLAVPEARGWKCTVTEQVAPAATVVPLHPSTSTKLVEPTEVVTWLEVALPEFDSTKVTVLLLEPRVTVPKSVSVPDNESTALGVPASKPASG